MLPDGLEQRFRELRRRPKERAALRADREAAVERVVFGTARDVWLPEIPLPPDRNRPAPRTVEEPGRDDLLAGLDAEGRPVLVRRAFGLADEAPAGVVAHPSELADTARCSKSHQGSETPPTCCSGTRPSSSTSRASPARSVCVLHVGWDEALRFEFLDRGDLTFYGDADDVRAGRWDRLTVSPESC